MTGFIKGLFGGKKGGNSAPQAAPAPQQPQSGDAFFLDFEEAQTFGNTEYMKKSNVIKRTFPRGKDRFSKVSSSNLDKLNESGISTSATPSFAKPQAQPAYQASSFGSSTTSSSKPAFSAPATGAQDRRSADSSMDMFRKMAKTIKK